MEAMQKNAQLPAQFAKARNLVRRYALLRILARILEHDIAVVARASRPAPHGRLLRGAQDRILLELTAIRVAFGASGIRLIHQQDAPHMRVTYRWGGGEHVFESRSNLRQEALELLHGCLHARGSGTAAG
ncbi:hypothetical protein IDH44_12425 [Paenibacillus sp. IB182496]|uniref:Uncharacterized protein n=1 Tax=Paenibacillus sabuli TaxID=2772509 RepID=A0A927GST4_9BACL|nr:hypothetical protein [Paenibacillus sabuli]MBD2846002.1 hypothetical protein [Paenibacillus sabuli]